MDALIQYAGMAALATFTPLTVFVLLDEISDTWLPASSVARIIRSIRRRLNENRFGRWTPWLWLTSQIVIAVAYIDLLLRAYSS